MNNIRIEKKTVIVEFYDEGLRGKFFKIKCPDYTTIKLPRDNKKSFDKQITDIIVKCEPKNGFRFSKTLTISEEPLVLHIEYVCEPLVLRLKKFIKNVLGGDDVLSWIHNSLDDKGRSHKYIIYIDNYGLAPTEKVELLLETDKTYKFSYMSKETLLVFEVETKTELFDKILPLFYDNHDIRFRADLEKSLSEIEDLLRSKNNEQ